MTSPFWVRTVVTRKVTSSDGADDPRRDAGDADADDVAVAVLTLGDDEEAGQQVLHQALRPEAERHAGDGGGGHQPGDRHPEPLHDEDEGDAVDDDQ